MTILFSGGCKNGKSTLAQRLAKALGGVPLYYVATMVPADEEDRLRIARHRREREGWGFETLEQPCDISGILRRVDTGGTFLLDSVTALLAGEMFPPGGPVFPGAGEKVAKDLENLAGSVGDLVLVSDAIYSDARRYDALTEGFRKALGYVDCHLARICDAVVEAGASRCTIHKGGEVLMPYVQALM